MRLSSIFTSVFAVVLLSLVLLRHTAPSAAQDASPMAESFTGSWLLTISAADGPPFPGMITFGADGVVVGSPPPVISFPPGGAGAVSFTSAGHGAWETTGQDASIFTFVVLAADGQGKPVGTVTISGSLGLSADGQTLSGDATATFADPRGTTVATLPETIQATRIVAEAPGTPAATPTT